MGDLDQPLEAALGFDRPREVDDAVAWAEQSPYPDAATLLDDVYESR